MKEKRKIFKNCSNKTQLFRVFNKYVSMKSFFLDLTIFFLGFFLLFKLRLEV